MEHPAGGVSAPVHRPPRPRAVAGVLPQREVPGVGGRGPARQAVGPGVGDSVQRPARTHGQRHQPVLQPRQQPGGVLLHGQLRPRVGHPQLARRDAGRRLLRRTGGTLQRKHQQRAERPVHGLQPPAGDRDGAGEDGAVRGPKRNDRTRMFCSGISDLFFTA